MKHITHQISSVFFLIAFTLQVAAAKDLPTLDQTPDRA